MAGRVRDKNVRHVLFSGGPSSPPFGGVDLSFVRGDVQEPRGGSRGFPTEDNEAEGGAAEERDMVTGGRRDSHL